MKPTMNHISKLVDAYEKAKGVDLSILEPMIIASMIRGESMITMKWDDNEINVIADSTLKEGEHYFIDSRGWIKPLIAAQTVSQQQAQTSAPRYIPVGTIIKCENNNCKAHLYLIRENLYEGSLIEEKYFQELWGNSVVTGSKLGCIRCGTSVLRLNSYLVTAINNATIIPNSTIQPRKGYKVVSVNYSLEDLWIQHGFPFNVKDMTGTPCTVTGVDKHNPDLYEMHWDNNGIIVNFLYSKTNQSFTYMGPALQGMAFDDPPSITSMSSQSALKCECGSEAVGSTRHSSWCPKFESQK